MNEWSRTWPLLVVLGVLIVMPTKSALQNPCINNLPALIFRFKMNGHLVPEISADLANDEPILWDKAHNIVACALAEGKTQVEAAAEAGITDRTLRNWLQNINFSAEVDRLSLMVGAASKAERLRIAKRVIRQKCQGEAVETEKDILDWVKYLQSETSGVVINFPPLSDGKPAELTTEPENAPSVAGKPSN